MQCNKIVNFVFLFLFSGASLSAMEGVKSGGVFMIVKVPTKFMCTIIEQNRVDVVESFMNSHSEQKYRPYCSAGSRHYGKKKIAIKGPTKKDHGCFKEHYSLLRTISNKDEVRFFKKTRDSDGIVEYDQENNIVLSIEQIKMCFKARLPFFKVFSAIFKKADLIRSGKYFTDK